MTTINPASTATGASSVSSALDKTEIASNFTMFLQLLTTQLRNQNPLDPLDTNQFTQQLVQFAQVEQQMKSNDQLASLVSLEKERAGHNGTCLCRGHGGGGWCNRTAHGRERQLESQCIQAFDGDHYDQGFDRSERLYRHHCGQSRDPDLHLERSRQ